MADGLKVCCLYIDIMMYKDLFNSTQPIETIDMNYEL